MPLCFNEELQNLHINIHTRPAGVRRGEDYRWSDRKLPTLDAADSDNRPLDVTFEQVLDGLAVLPRMLVEPDGSFVWVGAWDHGGGCWQLEGVLHDRGDLLSHVELTGLCSEPALDQLLHILTPPQTPLMFQLLPAAIFVDEQTVRQILFSGQHREPGKSGPEE